MSRHCGGWATREGLRTGTRHPRWWQADLASRAAGHLRPLPGPGPRRSSCWPLTHCSAAAQSPHWAALGRAPHLLQERLPQSWGLASRRSQVAASSTHQAENRAQGSLLVRLGKHYRTGPLGQLQPAPAAGPGSGVAPHSGGPWRLHLHLQCRATYRWEGLLGRTFEDGSLQDALCRQRFLAGAPVQCLTVNSSGAKLSGAM